MFTQSNLEAFGAAIEQNFREWTKNPNAEVKVSFEEGKKYVRVVRNDSHIRVVHSFIEIATGDVWKAASWKVPAKNKPRGNIANLTPNIVYWTGAK